MTMRLAIFFLFISSAVVGQHSLKFKIKGLAEGTDVLLGYYYGESTYSKDTAKVNTNNEFSFIGQQKLDKGVYFLATTKGSSSTRILEFIVGEDQDFKLETDTSEYILHMKVSGDNDNKVFFDNVVFNVIKQKEAAPFLKVIRDSTLAESAKTKAKEAYKRIGDEVTQYRENSIAKNNNTVAARVFAASQPLTAPQPPTLPNGAIDSTFQLRWYREHFFDYLSLSDDAMLRMPRPFYKEKVIEYLDKLYIQHADSLNAAIDKLVALAKPNKETYKYMVYTLLVKYQHPEIMGLDAIFVHIFDRYFASGEMDYWANETFKNNLKEHADRLRKSLIGKTGPNLIMQDKDFQKKALYDIGSSYTILYFFDPDCGACKKETPKLAKFYEKNKSTFDVEVFAVSADTSMQKMRDYIKELNLSWITVNGPRTYTLPYHDLYDSMTTPTLYVLDEKKKIIAKKVPAEQLEEFLLNYEKFNKKSGS